VDEMKAAQGELIACLLCVVMLPAMAKAQFTFTTNADNTLTLTGYSGTNGALTIPEMNNGMAVTAIGTGRYIIIPA